ncbi:DapH/DapD/GlmU-related protein [Lachnospiraceae bacterium 38-10]
MVIWRGILRVSPGKREEYIARIREENFIEKFTAQPGNRFYSIGAAVHDEDTLIVCDGWADRKSFEAHDTSKEVDKWREIYGEYVIDCDAELYEFGMTELEKLDAGLEYDFWDDEVNARKLYAIDGCRRIGSIDQKNGKELLRAITEFFGSAGERPWVGPGFQCDYGKNIHVGKHFTANYNVTILDIAPVHIGNHCMIGPNTLITTVGHPLSPAKRRKHIGLARPVIIGDDVWIGGNCTILPGVRIGNNVVVAAGAVVTKDVPNNCVVGGIPAKIIKNIEDDVER